MRRPEPHSSNCLIKKSDQPPILTRADKLDYVVWGIVEGKVRAMSHRNVEELKTMMKEEWAAMMSDFLRRSCPSV